MVDIKETLTGGYMDHKVSVAIREIENGYIFDRSWQEGTEKNMKYMNEQYFMEKLPGELEHLFKPGYMKYGKENKYERMAREMDEHSKPKPKKKVYKDTGDYGDEKPKKKGMYGRMQK